MVAEIAGAAAGQPPDFREGPDVSGCWALGCWPGASGRGLLDDLGHQIQAVFGLGCDGLVGSAAVGLGGRIGAQALGQPTGAEASLARSVLVNAARAATGV